MKFRRIGLTVACAIGLSSATQAAEMGFSIYPLGSMAFEAGAVPPPGLYVTTAVGYYTGNIGGNLPIGGVVAVDAKAKVFSSSLNILYVPQKEVLGGRLGFSVNAPSGHMNLDAQAVIGPLDVSRSVSGWGFGDTSLKAQLGWTHGSFNHMVYVMGVLPTGKYQPGFYPDIGLNRPAVDVGWGFTWLDTKLNLEFSAVLGVTFNAVNTATDYKTGDEFHAEWAIGKKLSQQLTVGAVGYVYKQLTGDSGSGARLGPFKGQTFGVGPGLTYTTKIGDHIAIFSVRHYHEFAVERRFGGGLSLASATLRF